MARLRLIRRGQRGNALVEYVLLVAMVALAVLIGVSFFGQSVSSAMGSVADEVASLLGEGNSGATGAANGQGNGNSNGRGNGAGNGGQNNGKGNGGQDNGSGNGK